MGWRKTCPSCGYKITAEQGLVRRSVRCPECGQSVFVRAMPSPEPDARPSRSGISTKWKGRIPYIAAFLLFSLLAYGECWKRSHISHMPPAHYGPRRAKLCEIGEGTSEVQKIVIARQLVKQFNM